MISGGAHPVEREDGTVLESGVPPLRFSLRPTDVGMMERIAVGLEWTACLARMDSDLHRGTVAEFLSAAEGPAVTALNQKGKE